MFEELRAELKEESNEELEELEEELEDGMRLRAERTVEERGRGREQVHAAMLNSKGHP